MSCPWAGRSEEIFVQGPISLGMKPAADCAAGFAFLHKVAPRRLPTHLFDRLRREALLVCCHRRPRIAVQPFPPLCKIRHMEHGTGLRIQLTPFQR